MKKPWMWVLGAAALAGVGYFIFKPKTASASVITDPKTGESKVVGTPAGPKPASGSACAVARLAGARDLAKNSFNGTSYFSAGKNAEGDCYQQGWDAAVVARAKASATAKKMSVDSVSYSVDGEDIGEGFASDAPDEG